MKSKSSLRIASLAAALAVAPALAIASPITYSGSGGSLSASVVFDTSGTNLIVTLTNTSSADAMAPGDILTGVFFDINGVGTLGRVSAILASGSVVNGNGGLTDAGGSVGGEWAYAAGITGPGLATEGISSSGLGLFGPGDVFGGTNLQGPADPDGVQYGITSAGDNPATGNGGISGQGLIQDSVVFTLSGLPSGFNPSALGAISHVNFQYGTALTETDIPGQPRQLQAVPEPATLALLGTGLTVAAARLRRRK